MPEWVQGSMKACVAVVSTQREADDWHSRTSAPVRNRRLRGDGGRRRTHCLGVGVLDRLCRRIQVLIRAVRLRRRAAILRSSTHRSAVVVHVLVVDVDRLVNFGAESLVISGPARSVSAIASLVKNVVWVRGLTSSITPRYPSQATCP